MAESTTTSQALTIRDDLWSKEIQELLQEELMGQAMVDFVSDFPDGDELHIPKFTDLSMTDYTENAAYAISDPTTGEFLLTIDKYKQSAVALTDKLKEDSFYVAEIQSKFPAMCVRAAMEQLETDIFLLHLKQTASNANTLNGQPHRFIATGTAEVISLADVAQAKLSLDKANVSKNGRVAVVDPTVSYQLLQIDNVIRQDVYGPNTHIKDGFGGSSYIGKYLGFDFYESNMLDEAGVYTGGTATGSFKANVFMGEEAFKGAIRSTPDIEFYRNAPYKRDEYSLNIRYGLGLYRAESLVTILTA
jgi:hypothetical protein